MITIAERRDAEIHITLEDSNMHAYMQIKAPYGGKNADVEAVHKAMKQMNIQEGIDDIAIAKTVQQEKCSHVLVASGISPIDGKDAYFEVLVEGDKHLGPTISENEWQIL